MLYCVLSVCLSPSSLFFCCQVFNMCAKPTHTYTHTHVYEHTISNLLHIVRSYSDGFQSNGVLKSEDKQSCCEHLFAISTLSTHTYLQYVYVYTDQSMCVELPFFSLSLSLFLCLFDLCCFGMTFLSLSLFLLLLPFVFQACPSSLYGHCFALS